MSTVADGMQVQWCLLKLVSRLLLLVEMSCRLERLQCLLVLDLLVIQIVLLAMMMRWCEEAFPKFRSSPCVH